MASSNIKRDPMSGGYSSKGTWSFWIKVAEPNASTNQGIFQIRKGNSYANSRLRIYLDTNKLSFELKDSGGSDDSFFKTNATLSDVAAWYHICLSYDSTLGTASERLKMWINGKDVRTEYGGFGSDDQVGSGFQYLASSDMYIALGSVDENNGVTSYFNGCMAECYFVYDSTYDVSTFGETDSTTGIWKPKVDISTGITFGSQGFYFAFTNSADMKADSSGNSNTYTYSGTVTQTKDCPDSNMSSMNPSSNFWSNFTFSNANNSVVSGSSGYYSPITSTLGFLPTTGKYYTEVKFDTASTTVYSFIGITGSLISENNKNIGGRTYGYAYAYNGQKYNNNSGSSYGNGYVEGDIIGIAVDATNSKIYFSKNGTWQNSGNPESGSTGTGAAFTISTTPTQGFYFFGCSDDNNGTGTSAWSWNFGSGYFGTTAITTNSGNGYKGAEGASKFNYSVPSGYSALNTKGLNT